MKTDILVLLIKNTAALDFALPLLCKIRDDHPQKRISVLSCVLSKKQVFRDTTFYEKTMRDFDIKQYDFADFLPQPICYFRNLFRILFGKSKWDSFSSINKIPIRLVVKILTLVFSRLIGWLETRALSSIDYAKIINDFGAQGYLLDNTNLKNFYGQKALFDAIKGTNNKIYLLPHAPHHASLCAFAPFNGPAEPLPDQTEYWMPFIFEKSWESCPERKKQFVYVGYPGLDSQWLSRIKVNSKSRRNKPQRCLLIIRKFFASKTQKRVPVNDDFTYDYEEFLMLLKSIRQGLADKSVAIELLVKPHPSNDYQILKNIFAKAGIFNMRIVDDSIYGLLPEIDLVISLYSTTLLVPAMLGIPVILLNSSISERLMQAGQFANLYKGVHFFIENQQDVSRDLPKIIQAINEQNGNDKNEQVRKHLRHFFPDEAYKRCYRQLGLI